MGSAGGATALPDEPELSSAVFHTDQYRAFAALREERPVCRGRYFDGAPIWLVTRYDDVSGALEDSRLMNDLSGQARLDDAAAFAIPPDLRPYWHRNMLHADPPDHTRLRRLVTGAMTARRVRALRPRVQAITDGLLDDLIPCDGPDVDLVDRLAYPLPITVISDLLGVPAPDRADWRRWAMALVLTTPDPRQQRADLADGARCIVDFTFHLIRLRRADPGDDLISALVKVHDRDHDQLDDRELVAMVIALLGAGHRTTVRLIANGLFALLTHPGQLRLVRDDPSLLPQAVDEVLRYLTPVELAAPRLAAEDVQVGGVPVPAGDVVQVVLGAANRDPRRFHDPDRFDILRRDRSHVAFGHGAHVCPGAALARMEAEVAFGTLLARFPALALGVPPEEVPWSPSFARGPTKLPVRLG